jgi:hypothetical protein
VHLVSLLHSLQFMVRSRASLHLEILALRHQLAVVHRSRRPRLRFTAADRLWTWLSQVWSGWRSSVHIVRPDTVIAWHRRGAVCSGHGRSIDHLQRERVVVDANTLNLAALATTIGRRGSTGAASDRRYETTCQISLSLSCLNDGTCLPGTPFRIVRKRSSSSLPRVKLPDVRGGPLSPRPAGPVTGLTRSIEHTLTGRHGVAVAGQGVLPIIRLLGGRGHHNQRRHTTPPLLLRAPGPQPVDERGQRDQCRDRRVRRLHLGHEHDAERETEQRNEPGQL